MKFVHAQEGKITNPVIGKYGAQKGIQTIGELLTNIFNAMIIAGAIILVIMIIWSGIDWMTAGGDKERLQRAQKRLTNALVGFVILICVFAIANFIGGFFGLGWFKTFRLPFPTPQ